jgi:hypothetical protein
MSRRGAVLRRLRDFLYHKLNRITVSILKRLGGAFGQRPVIDSNPPLALKFQSSITLAATGYDLPRVKHLAKQYNGDPSNVWQAALAITLHYMTPPK